MPDVANADFSTIRPESRAGLRTDAFNRELARATPPGSASGRMVTRGVEIHTDGSNPSLSATNLVSETTKKGKYPPAKPGALSFGPLKAA